MAGGPQHTIKIMATQTRFDLNAAVESWRNELAAQPQLSSDDRRELEKHLADTMAELRQRGLNEEESFWLACRRTGRPQQLAEEFEKADPAGVWRERMFWIAVASLFYFLWSGFFMCFMYRPGFISGSIWLGILRYILVDILPVCLVVCLAKGKMKVKNSTLAAIFRNRWLLVFCAMIFLLVTHGLQIFTYNGFTFYRYPNGPIWMVQALNVIPPVMFLVVIAWLMPGQKRKNIKPA
jgi:hypothetical protein